MKLKYLVIIILISAQAHAQLNSLLNTDIDFWEVQADSIHFKLDSVLIIATGTSATRIFLDDMTKKISNELNSQEIVTSYHYLGRNRAEIKKKFDQIDQKGYKAVLYIFPDDTSYFNTRYNTTRSTSETFYGPITTTITTSRLSFQQVLHFQFHKMNDMSEIFWKARVDVDCDPGKKYAAKRIAKKLLAQFRKNKYIK